MRQTTGTGRKSSEKIRIVLDGLRGEDSIAELCRRDSLSRKRFGMARFDLSNVEWTTSLSNVCGDL